LLIKKLVGTSEKNILYYSEFLTFQSKETSSRNEKINITSLPYSNIRFIIIHNNLVDVEHPNELEFVIDSHKLLFEIPESSKISTNGTLFSIG
jgi:hypothetical protein